MDELVPIAEAAELLNIKLGTLRGYLRDGGLRGVKGGRMIHGRVPWSHVTRESLVLWAELQATAHVRAGQTWSALCQDRAPGEFCGRCGVELVEGRCEYCEEERAGRPYYYQRVVEPRAQCALRVRVHETVRGGGW